MTRRELSQVNVEDVLRRSLQRGGDSVAVPDLWPAVRARISASGGVPWWRGVMRWPAAPSWLAPAGAVALVVTVVVLGIVLMNSSDDANTGQHATQPEATAGSRLLEGAATDAEVFTNALRSLESAGPFRVDSESTIPSYTEGGLMDYTWPPYSSHSLFWRRFPDARDSGTAVEILTSDEIQDANCETFEYGHICDKVFGPTGEKLGTSYWFNARHVGAGIFESSETYRTRRQLRIDPVLKNEISRRTGGTSLSHFESIYEFRQEDDTASVVDGINHFSPEFTRLGENIPTEGSLYAFLMAHLAPVHVYPALYLDPVLQSDFAQLPKDIIDAANFSNIERVTPHGETESDGLVHYRADINGFLGDTGFWEMWISPADGLPRRISIEAYKAPSSGDGPLEVTRATLNFSRFGEEDMNIYSDLLLLPYP